MTITKAIDFLTKALAEHGDLPIANIADVDGNFNVEYGKLFDVIEVHPNTGQPEKLIGLIEPLDYQGGTLTVVK
jgi:hypothetical protein